MNSILSRTLNLIVFTLALLSSLYGCTLDAAAVRNQGVDERFSRVARMIDQQKELLMSESVAKELSEEELAVLVSNDGEAVARGMLGEEDGRAVMDYVYTASTSQDAYEVLDSAKGLMSAEDYEQVKSQIASIEDDARHLYAMNSRAMTTAQMKKFYGELKSLVVKATVLLTAAIVYAFIPKVMVWGKVSAACVAAVAAGILASGIMTVIEYKNYGGEKVEFTEWISSIYEDAFAEWAIASSIITTGAAAGYSPVITALIIAAFALYDVLDEADGMYKLVNKG